jgi:hypothetical protein
LRVTVAPAIEPVTVDEVKAELGVTDHTSDARIARLITSARLLAEAFTNRALITQTLVFALDRFPPAALPWWDGVRHASIHTWAGTGPIVLPRPPIQTLTSIVYYDESNTEATFDSSNYYLDDISEPARVVLNYGRAWPVGVRTQQAVKVTYVAGYGANPASVPSAFVDAIMAHVTDAYTRPNASVTSETIDNASVTYAYGGVTGGTAQSGAQRLGGGLRAEAAAILAPYRVMDLGM